MLFCPECFSEFETDGEAGREKSETAENTDSPLCPQCGGPMDGAVSACPSCSASEDGDAGFSSADGLSGGLPEGVDESSLIDKRYFIAENYKVGCSESVYLAEDLLDNRNPYTIREFTVTGEGLSRCDELAARFDEVAGRIEKIAHPSIGRIFDYFNQENNFYVVYDFVEGTPLPDFLEEFHNTLSMAIPEGVLVDFALKLCDMLAYLHEIPGAPFYCVEMKPSSLIVSSDVSRLSIVGLGVPYLKEALGIIYDDDLDEDRSKTIPGELKSSSRDLWCLGAVLYFLISGLDLQRFDSLPHSPVEQIRPDLSPAFQEILTTLLGKDRKSGYASVEEVRSELSTRCRARGIVTYDFYYRFIGFEPSSVDWNNWMAGGERISSIGKAPSIPMTSQWTFNTSSTAKASAAPLGDGNIAVAFGDGQIFLLDREKGGCLWNCHMKDSLNSIVTRGGRLFASSGSQSIFCVEAGSALPGIWRTKIDGMLMTGPCFFGDKLFQLSYDGNLFILDINTGVLREQHHFNAKAISHGLVYEDIFYFGSLNGILYAYDSVNMTPLWHYNTGASISTACSVAEDNIVAANTDGNIFCVDRHNATINWKLALEDIVTSPVRLMGNTYFCITQKGILHNISDSGNINWRVNLGLPGEYSFAVTNNKIYAVTPDGRILCIDVFSGRLTDKSAVKETVVAQPVIYDGTLILVTSSGTVHAFT